MDAIHPRDISESSVSKSVDAQFPNGGSIVPISNIKNDIALHRDLMVGGFNLLDYKSGEGVYHFKSDHNLSQRVHILGTGATGTDDEIRMYTSTPHGFKTGLSITISGLFETMCGNHEIINVNDEYSFDISSTADANIHAVAAGDVAVDTSTNNSGTIDSNKFDDEILLDGAFGQGDLNGRLIKINSELMLVIGNLGPADNKTKYKVIRAWPDGSTGLASHSDAQDVLYAPQILTTCSIDFGSSDGYTGFAHYTEIVTSDNSDTNLFIIMNGSRICLTDGNVMLKDVGSLASTLTLGASSGHCHTLDEKFRVGSDSLTFDQENKRFPNGKLNPSFLDTSDGILISAVQTEDNADIASDAYMSPQLLTYNEPTMIGDGYTNAVNNVGSYTNGSRNYSTILTGSVVSSFYAEHNADEIARLYVNHGSNLTIEDDILVTVTFDLRQYNGDDLYSDQTKNTPVIYFSEAISDTGVIARSTQCKARYGKNTFVFYANGGTMTGTGKNAGNLINNSSSGATSYLIFETYNKCSYQVENLTVHKTATATQHGWHILPTGLDVPLIAAEHHASGTATVNTNYKAYLAIDEDTDVTGDWDFNAGPHGFLNFGISGLFFDSETESSIRSAGAIGALNNASSNLVSIKGNIRFTSANTGRGWPAGLKGFRIYITGWGEDAANAIDDPLHFADVYLDKRKRSSVLRDYELSFAVQNNIDMIMVFSGVTRVPGNTYESTMAVYSLDDATIPQSIFRFSSSCNVNGVTYIGNVTQYSRSDGTVKAYPDRVMKCAGGDPVKPLFFPSNNRLDVAVDDGDSIVNLLSYDLMIFQFKRNVVYIISIDPNTGFESLAKTLKGVGINNKNAATETAAGIVWVNESGCYMYDGEKLNNLMRGQISRESWRNNFSGNNNIGYSNIDQSLICAGTSKTYIYSFLDEHWIESSFSSDIDYISNMLSIHDLGACWFRASLEELSTGENITMVNNTTGVPGKRALGSFSWSGGNLDSGDNLTTTLEFWGKDSGGTARQLHSVSLYDKAAEDFGQYNNGAFTGENWTSSRYYTRGTIYNTYDEDLNFISGTIHIASTMLGTILNANASGSAGLYIDTDGTTTGGDGNLTGTTHVALSGGVAPTAPVRHIVIDRDSEVGANVSYNVVVHVWKQNINLQGAFPATFTTPSNTVQALEGWVKMNTFNFTYVTSYEDDNDNVRDGIKALMAADGLFSSYFSVTTSSNTIILTGKDVPIGSGSYSTGDFGYYHPLGLDGTINNGIEVSLVGADGGEVTTNSNALSLMNWQPLSNPSTSGSFQVTTRDLFNQSVGQRKKIYKVYISYKCTGESNITVKFITDGKKATDSNKKVFTGVSNYTSSTLDTTSGDWSRAELKPTTSSDVKNVQSFRLVFENNGAGETPFDFAINDMTVVYRAKNVK